MKRIGFRDAADPGIPPPPVGRDPRATLASEEPETYARLMDHLAGRSPLLTDWVERLKRGDAGVVLTGQQPALLGGPLYTLYKSMTALAAARRMRAEGKAAIAAFWCVGDDTDFGEVSWASWPIPGGPPRRVRDETPHEGDRIGGMSAARMRRGLERMREDWPDSPIVSRLDGWLDGDWSSFIEQSLRTIAGDEPLLFVDGNDPEVIHASQAWLRRFLPLRRRIADGIRSLVPAAAAGGEPPISEEEALRSLFVIDGRTRRALDPSDDSIDEGTLLLPNVVLRPALQEHILPVERVVCGDAEIAYRGMLGPVYEILGRPAAPMMGRFAATLFPPGWLSLEDRPDPGDAIDRTDEALDAWARRSIGPDLFRRLSEERSRVRDALGQLSDPLGRLDAGLAQVLESAAGKVDFQLRRLEEAVAAKGRSALYRKSRDLAHLREILRPRGRAQERSFVLWTPVLAEGIGALGSIAEAVEEWIDRGAKGHALLVLEGTAWGIKEGR